MILKATILLSFILVGCQKMNTNDDTLHAPMSVPVNLSKIDSRTIETTFQYQLLININLTLLEYDKDSNLVTLLAEDYEINDRTITFQIKKGIRTKNNHEIKAIDAEISLKRLIISKGSHSRLSQLLCSEENSPDCPGISSKNYELKLVAKKKSYIPFILNLLTSADNVIFPTTALSSQSPESKIINFLETTGPYYIDADIKDVNLNHFELKLNNFHFLNKDLPKSILYSLVEDSEIFVENKLNPRFNYIHNVLSVRIEKLDKLKDNDSSVKIYNTGPLKNAMIFTTQNGKNKFSSLDLLHHELSIKKALLNSKDSFPNIRQIQTEYFPSGSDGALRTEQAIELENTYNLALKHKPKKYPIVLGLFPGNYERYHKVFLNSDMIKTIKLTDESLENEADLYIDTIDTSFQESLDLLEYAKNFGIFKISDEEMQLYIDANSKNERLKILQNVHFNSLMAGYCLTIGSSPYVTIINKKWEAAPPTIFVGFPVWKITKKN